MSVYDPDAPRPDPAIWEGRIPVLGICYGAQLMALELGGDVLPTARREYGPATVTITADDGLFTGLDRDQPVWMSHGDSITSLPEGFVSTAETGSTPFAGLVDPGHEAEEDAPAAETVELGQLLRQQHRVAPEGDDVGAQAEPLGAPGGEGQGVIGFRAPGHLRPIQNIISLAAGLGGVEGADAAFLALGNVVQDYFNYL